MNPSESVAVAASEWIDFGDFSLDRVRRRVWRNDGTPVVLSARLFDALLFFVEHAGNLLDKDELLAALWPGQIVEENNLNQIVLALRRALGDDRGENRYILTVPRRGFRFVAHVRPVHAADPKPGGDGVASALALADVAPPPGSIASTTAGSKPPTTGRRRAIVAGAAVAVGGVGAMTWRAFVKPEAAARPSPATHVAVLPFKPLVDEGRDEVLELGMADSLIARLSSARGIVVRSVSSVRRYGRTDTDPLRAARDLEVAWIVDGTVQRSGDRVRVTARLLNAADGMSAWSGSFDERFTDVFDVQDAISQRVAAALVPQLSARESAGLSAAGTRNTEAYQLYLAARSQSMLFTPDAYRRSLALYQQAVAADPNYAYAYVGLADLHRRTQFTSNTAPRDAFEPTRAAAARAIELDPAFGDAHAMAGWVSYLYDWDWGRAERTFRHAAALNPSCADAHSGLGHVLTTTGRGAEGLSSFMRLREVDPLSPYANAFEGTNLLLHDRYDEGIERIKRALAINPSFWIAHLFLGNAYVLIGQTEEGLPSLQRAAEFSGGSAWATGPLGYALARAGRADEARRVLDGMVAKSRSGYVSPAAVALVQVGLGENERALEWLDKAHQVRDSRLIFLQIDHRWNPLRDDARFIALARKLALDPSPPRQWLGY